MTSLREGYDRHADIGVSASIESVDKTSVTIGGCINLRTDQSVLLESVVVSWGIHGCNPTDR